jgi:hypothetical protein
MARYNTATLQQTISAAATINSPVEGSYFKFTGTAPYTVNLPTPASTSGVPFTFYNSTSGTITLSTSSGSFVGSSGSLAGTQTVLTTATVNIVSDGTNYIVLAATGGPIAASTLSATSTVTLSPANANVVLSPTGTGVVTINPATAGTINNVAIGGSTAAAGTFTDFTATGTTTLQQIAEKITSISSYGTSQSSAFTSAGVYYLTGMTGNFTFNWTSVPSTTGRSFTLTMILAQGGTAYVPTTLQINSSGVSIGWAGGVTPTGRANKIDVVSFYIYNISGTFVAIASMGSYG